MSRPGKTAEGPPARLAISGSGPEKPPLENAGSSIAGERTLRSLGTDPFPGSAKGLRRGALWPRVLLFRVAGFEAG